MSGGYYVLNGKEPVPCDDVKEWGAFFSTADRIVGSTTIADRRVSTVFLALDHSFGSGPPVLFETMVFVVGGEPGESNELQRRYCTWAEAEAGHAAVVAEVLAIARLKDPVVVVVDAVAEAREQAASALARQP